jgi:ABC-type spermidine/putrescine transport system permease subunit II
MTSSSVANRHALPVKLSVAFAVSAAVWSVGMGLALWFVPNVYGQRLSDVSDSGAWPVIVPAVVTGVAALFAWRRFTAAYVLTTVLMGLLIVIAGFSIGEYYVPAGILLMLGLFAIIAAQPD